MRRNTVNLSYEGHAHDTLIPYHLRCPVRQLAYESGRFCGRPKKTGDIYSAWASRCPKHQADCETSGVRDSDIIRFAIKSTLNRVAPLCDQAIRGRNLVPVLVESGDELIRYFELDSFRLESIINEQVEEGRQVERDDIALLAMGGLREEYLVMRLKDGSGATVDTTAPARSLRGYLYDKKYVYRSTEHQPSSVRSVPDSTPPPEPSARIPLRQPA